MNKEYVHKKVDSSPTATAAGGTFQPRAFAAQAKAEGAAKEQVEAAPGSDNLLKRVRVSQRNAIQPKLAIGTPGDKYEREADAIAEGVMNAPERAIAANITPIASGDAIQSKGAGESSAPAGGSNLESQLNQSNTGGTPLPPQVRAFMEPRIGADFSSVRVHADAGAAQMNRQLSARAFTYGNHIYYGAGKSPSNDALTAHELIHVEQQTGNGGARSGGSIQRQAVQQPNSNPDPWSSAKLQDNPEFKNDDKQAGAKFTKKDTPLFPNDNKPNPEDVRQGALGDCYLQASLASIAAEKPDYLKEMMRDNGDGTVTVRLYEVDQTVGKAHKFTPKYIKVEKSIATDASGSGLYNHGALWVQMVEKAYAAAGFTGSGKATGASAPSYENIEQNGLVRYAMEVVLGKQPKYLDVKGSVSYNSDKAQYENPLDFIGFKGDLAGYENVKADGLPWDAETEASYDEVKAKTPENYSALGQLNAIFENQSQIDAWMEFVKKRSILNMFVKQEQNRKKWNASIITLESFERLLDEEQFAYKEKIMTWIRNQRIFPGEMGTGIYSKIQLDQFDTIKKAVDNGQVIAANTHTTLTQGAGDGVGKSANEQKSEGLVGGHAYTVLDYRENASTNPDDANATGHFYWLKLRNPWGDTGRKYEFLGNNKVRVSEDESKGTFWLELTDFAKYFATITMD